MARVKKMTVADVIDQVLGGTTKTALYLGVTPHAVSMMKSRGAFPWRHHAKIVKACSEAGVNYDPSAR